jgi:hypothetical protein
MIAIGYAPPAVIEIDIEDLDAITRILAYSWPARLAERFDLLGSMAALYRSAQRLGYTAECDFPRHRLRIGDALEAEYGDGRYRQRLDRLRWHVDALHDEDDQQIEGVRTLVQLKVAHYHHVARVRAAAIRGRADAARARAIAAIATHDPWAALLVGDVVRPHTGPTRDAGRPRADWLAAGDARLEAINIGRAHRRALLAAIGVTPSRRQHRR